MIVSLPRAKSRISLRQFFTMAGFPGLVLLMYHVILGLISRRRTVEDAATVDGSAMVQIAMAGVAFGMGFFVLHRNYFARYLIFQSPLKWLLLYSIVGSISSIWSVDPALTLYRAFEHLAYLILFSAVISTLYTRVSVEEMVQWVMYYAVFAIMVSNIRRAQLGGLSIFSVDNLLLEQMASTPYFFLALLLPVGWLVKILVLPISLLSFSNTAYVGMMLGSFALRKGNIWLRRLSLILVIVAISAWLAFDTETILQNTVFYGKEGVGMEYTTGRDKIIELSLEAALQRPFTGYGFTAGELFIITKEREGVIGAHNGFISAMLGLGVPGVLLLVFLFIHIFKVANSSFLPPIYRSAFLATVLLIGVHTIGNPGLGTRVYGAWFPAVMIFTLISMVNYKYKFDFSENEDNLGNP